MSNIPILTQPIYGPCTCRTCGGAKTTEVSVRCGDLFGVPIGADDDMAATTTDVVWCPDCDATGVEIGLPDDLAQRFELFRRVALSLERDLRPDEDDFLFDGGFWQSLLGKRLYPSRYAYEILGDLAEDAASWRDQVREEAAHYPGWSLDA